jgi:hypothetical protein
LLCWVHNKKTKQGLFFSFVWSLKMFVVEWTNEAGTDCARTFDRWADAMDFVDRLEQRNLSAWVEEI